MSEAFDPYHVWLGIPPEEQPPNYYRLLGLPLFEEKVEAIEHAADQRMSYVRTFQAGKRSKESQQILNELATARVRLLNPDKKATYDEQLRREREERDREERDREERDRTEITPQSAAALLSPGAPRPAEPIPASRAGSGQLGEYMLQEKLGEGGMGTVYRALHTKLGRVVALKVLPKDRVWDARAVARFEREMKSAGAVDHPNVVRAMDARDVEGTRFLVMEFVDGIDLNELGRQCHPLPIADICEIIRQIALGLEEIHHHGLVHRDVKPSNVMLTGNGVVKILDLGLARLEFDATAPDEVTGSGLALGTIDYMSPEQISDSRLVDIRADIYGLGCTFYKMLTGRTPFADCKGPAERLVAHTRMPPPPVQQLRKDVPEDVVRILERMMAKSATDRFPTPAHVADAIGRMATGSDLRMLVAKARKLPLPEPMPQQATIVADDSSSSGMTRFFADIVTPSPERSMPAPPRQPAMPAAAKPQLKTQPKAPAKKSRTPIVVAAGFGAVCLVLFMLFALGAFKGGLAEGVLVIDWPESQRAGGALVVDGKAVSDRTPNPVKHRCAPGEHTLSGVRPGFRPFKQTVQVKAGEERSVALTWQPEPNVRLDWPVTERSGARLLIDDVSQDIPTLALRSPLGGIQLTLKPGPHRLAIERLGYELFEATVTAAEGREVVVRPMFKENVSSGQAAKPAAPAKPEAKPEVPATAQGEQKPMPPTPTPAQRSPAGADPELERQGAIEAKYAKALQDVEKKTVEWDFPGAIAALASVSFAEAELSARLATRADEIKRLAALKARIIAGVNEGSRSLKKADLGMRGINAEISHADEAGLTAQLPGGKSESYPWKDLSAKALQKLAQSVLDPENADDRIAAGLLCLICQDVATAETCFTKAEALGAKMAPHWSTLAAAAFARIVEMLGKKQFHEADAAVSALEAKYARAGWVADHKTTIAAARAKAKAGIAEVEAEKLYSEAVALFDARQYFDLKPVVERLKAEYPGSAPVTDGQRQPSLPQMEIMLKRLGKTITVSMDGKSDFKTLQAAIDAASPHSLIEIQDNGPYAEPLTIPPAMQGLTVRGKKGCWPMLTSVGNAAAASGPLVTVNASDVSIERFVVAHESPADRQIRGVIVSAGSLRLRSSLVAMYGSREGIYVDDSAELHTQDCLLASEITSPGKTVANNCVFLGSLNRGNYTMRLCTLRAAGMALSRVTLEECIAYQVAESSLPNVQNSNVFSGQPLTASVPFGKGTFSADPMFRDATGLDFRLQDGSPCAGKAAGGGDIGCRYTADLIELSKQALEQRRRGMLKF